MYRTTPINRNKVLQGLQNLKFDDVENYRTHVFEKHSVMNDKENLNMVLQGNKKTKVVSSQTQTDLKIQMETWSMPKKL